MGYYVRTEDTNIVLGKDKLDEAYKRMCQLDLHDEWKRGGGGGALWFSWLDENYATIHKTAEEILKAVGYDTSFTSNGDLRINNYDNKTGCEDVFLWSFSDLCNEGSSVIWVGEDNERWLWEFGGGQKVVQSVAEVTYVNPTPFEPTDWRVITNAIMGV
jgi:hypothetical protein